MQVSKKVDNLCSIWIVKNTSNMLGVLAKREVEMFEMASRSRPRAYAGF